MSENPTAASVRPRQELRTRIFWFFAGSVVNYLMITTPFKWLEAHTQLSKGTIADCSIAIATTFFFLWNYHINFRTQKRKREALPRYIGAVIFMGLLSSQLLGFLKQHDYHVHLAIGKWHPDLDVIATQLMLGGLKFLLYHRWVFPPAAVVVRKPT